MTHHSITRCHKVCDNVTQTHRICQCMSSQDTNLMVCFGPPQPAAPVGRYVITAHTSEHRRFIWFREPYLTSNEYAKYCGPGDIFASNMIHMALASRQQENINVGPRYLLL